MIVNNLQNPYAINEVYTSKPLSNESSSLSANSVPTKDRIVKKVTKYINKRFDLNLVADQAEIQNHHVNSEAGLHVHDHDGREHITYNSLIYLNDNFDGGQFITKNGISIKPEKGMLTFFNGQTVCHGVKKVLNKDRKTIIFWWKG